MFLSLIFEVINTSLGTLLFERKAIVFLFLFFGYKSDSILLNMDE